MISLQRLSRFRAFFLANAMLGMYILSVAVSIAIAVIIGHYTVDYSAHHLLHITVRKYAAYYDLPVAVLELVIIVLYERPIRGLIKNRHLRKKPASAEILNAYRRLLNEPFFLMALNLVTWVGAAVFYYFLARSVIVQPDLAKELIVSSLLTAVIGVLATFFCLQYCIQRWLAPVLFPEGGLSHVAGVLRIKLSTRLAALTAATCLAPLFIIGVTLYGAERQRLYGVHPESVLDHLSATLIVELFLFSIMAVALTYLVAVNLSRPFRDIIAVLHQIRKGHFNRRVRVVSNDEIGYTGDAINAMAAGLQERERMRRSLSLAREVQQGLLPKKAPVVPNLDIAGKSIYCDETGGDYFDYIFLNHGEDARLAAVIADVSGHGVSAALLMTSVRALLRARAMNPGGPAEILSHLNRQITRDTEETGQFVTLFYLEVSPRSRSLGWARAGHDPAYFYRAADDKFELLDAPGTALGIRADSIYSGKTGQARPGDIILLTTDGIFETRRVNDMFGRERFMDIVRANHRSSAAGLRDVILGEVTDFRGSNLQEDDVTLVVFKFT